MIFFLSMKVKSKGEKDMFGGVLYLCLHLEHHLKGQYPVPESVRWMDTSIGL